MSDEKKKRTAPVKAGLDYVGFKAAEGTHPSQVRLLVSAAIDEVKKAIAEAEANGEKRVTLGANVYDVEKGDKVVEKVDVAVQKGKEHRKQQASAPERD